jgi:hypothetical protein
MKPSNKSAVNPITKEQVLQNIKQRSFPDFVIQAFNQLIEAEKIKHSDSVYQKDVLALIVKLGNVTHSTIFENNWLDIEDYYKSVGWNVVYHKPSFNESGEPYFVFT